MKQKRIRFALLICIFLLCGCMSGSNIQNEHQHIDQKANKIYEGEPMALIAFAQGDETLPSKHIFDIACAKYKEEYRIKLEKEKARKEALRKKKEALRKKQEALRKKQEEERKKQAAQRERLKNLERKSQEVGGSNFFYPYTTTYGIDCYGCGGEDGNGYTSLGVALDMEKGVQMSDGSWQAGIRYGQYYIIAADPTIPLCSIVKIENHGLQGSGISPDQPYYAIVLDRGGAIYGNHIDLYIGSENSNAIYQVYDSKAKATIIRYGGQNGPNSCGL